MNQDSLYKSTIKNSALGFAYFKIITDKKGKPINFRCLEVNPAFLRKTGFKAKDVIGKTINQIFPKTSKEKTDWIKLCGKVALKNQKYVVEHFFQNFQRWLRVELFSPTKGYFATIILDITKRKQAEESLMKNEEKYHSLVNNLNVGIFRSTPTGKGQFIEVNPAMVKIFGYKSIKDLAKHNVSDLYATPDERKIFISKLKNEGFIKSQEILAKKKDGTKFWVAVTARVNRDKFGKITWIDGIVEDIDEQKRIQTSLLELYNENKALLSAIPDIVMHVDKNKKYVWANQAGYEFFGDDVIGKKASYYFVGKQKTYEIVQSIFNGKEDVVYLESWQRRKDGEKRLLAWWCKTLKNPHGDVIGALSTARDITESRLAQEALQTSEEKYRTLVQNVTIGVYRNSPDAQGRFLEVNPAMVKMFGYSSAEEMKQTDIADMYQDKSDRIRLLKKFAKNGYVIGEEIRLKRKDGTPIYVNLFARTHKNKEGKIDWIDGVIEDITYRKQTEVALAESELKYRTLVDVLPYGIAAHSEGKIVFVNPAAIKMMRAKSENELIGKPIIDFVHPDYLDLVKKRVSSMIKSGQPEPPAQEKFIRLDGTTVDVEVYAKPFTYQNKPAIMLTAIDITERKKTEQEQKQLNEQTIRCQNALLKLSKIKVVSFDQVIKDILETDAKTLNVERVSYWSFNRNRTEITCDDIYLKSKNSHKKGTGLNIKNYPHYFKALAKGRIITATDAWHDLRTREFTQNYLRPLGITSMMDVPVRLHGKIVGIICHEHIGPMRKWTSEEQNFAISIADYISLYSETLELKRAEQTIKQSEEKYRSLVHNVNIGVYRSTPQNKFLEVNPAIVKMFGYDSISEMMKIPVTNLYQKASDRNELISKLTKNGQVKNFEVQQKRKDGSLIDVSITARAHYDINGKIDWYDGVVEDITQRKKALEALRQSEEKYRNIFNIANDGILIISPTGKIISANPQALKLSGLSEKVIGLNIAELGILPRQSLQIIQNNLKARLQGKDVKPYEVEIYPKNSNSKLTVEISASLLRDASGKPVADLAILHDVTERKQYELELKKAKEEAEFANKAKTTFLHNMSHELRTPMTSIIGFTDILLDNETDLDNREMLNIVKNSSNHLLKIINDLLDLSRIEAGRIYIEKTKCNTREAIQEIYKRFKLFASEKNIDFILHINRNLPEYIITDCTKIAQILSNLLDNAIKFTEKGKVELSVGLKQPIRNNKSILELIIKDTGIGIAQDRIDKIFESFVQGEYYISKRFSGAGLGLPIIKKLTELLHGTISVDSELAKGTKFTVLIPVEIVPRKK